GTDQAGYVWPGCGYELVASGGWDDAGDHGKYVVYGGVGVWTLLNLAARGARLLLPDADGSLYIPERGSGRSDLLDEVRW
ncbi:glycoside hydrolase family 9 protein, partial [Deinococcus sp. GbtcB9]|uniref:glycoside hydrolase family 9 protein n=1 Tax=Deinococcus sp. GbtcB9 TaxID=2824754 RepID=UPI001C2F6A20